MTEEQKQVEEEAEVVEDWRSDISGSPKPTLKIADGEEKTIVFLDGGEKRTHPDYGNSIVFQVEEAEESKNFYVRENNYSLLGQIKELGKLIGKVVKISRKGSKKSDTRYTIEEVQVKSE